MILRGSSISVPSFIISPQSEIFFDLTAGLRRTPLEAKALIECGSLEASRKWVVSYRWSIATNPVSRKVSDILSLKHLGSTILGQ